MPFQEVFQTFGHRTHRQVYRRTDRYLQTVDEDPYLFDHWIGMDLHRPCHVPVGGRYRDDGIPRGQGCDHTVVRDYHGRIGCVPYEIVLHTRRDGLDTDRYRRARIYIQLVCIQCEILDRGVVPRHMHVHVLGDGTVRRRYRHHGITHRMRLQSSSFNGHHTCIGRAPNQLGFHPRRDRGHAHHIRPLGIQDHAVHIQDDVLHGHPLPHGVKHGTEHRDLQPKFGTGIVLRNPVWRGGPSDEGEPFHLGFVIRYFECVRHIHRDVLHIGRPSLPAVHVEGQGVPEVNRLRRLRPYRGEHHVVAYRDPLPGLIRRPSGHPCVEYLPLRGFERALRDEEERTEVHGHGIHLPRSRTWIEVHGHFIDGPSHLHLHIAVDGPLHERQSIGVPSSVHHTVGRLGRERQHRIPAERRHEILAHHIQHRTRRHGVLRRARRDRTAVRLYHIDHGNIDGKPRLYYHLVARIDYPNHIDTVLQRVSGDVRVRELSVQSHQRGFAYKVKLLVE